MEHFNLAVVIATPILTFIANYIFYRFIKSDVDKKIHQNNIAFSGVFQEKIEVYRELLGTIYDIKVQLYIYGKSKTQENAKTTVLLLLDFRRFFIVNQPFLSDSMLMDLNKLRETFSLLYKMQCENLADNEEKVDLELVLEEFSTETLEKIEKKLVAEMKEELNPL